MNQKNKLGLNECFQDLNNPIELFKIWMETAKKNEINDPNALSLATADKEGNPSVRMVLLKEFSEKGFIFYTNLNSQKSKEIKINPKAAMCFHWKSILRQVRIYGSVKKIDDNIANKYFNSRDYESRIGAWASNQSEILENRDKLFKLIEKYKLKYPNSESITRPNHWSGWNLIPSSIEFWLQIPNRIHERLKYEKLNNEWKKFLLNP